MLAANAPSRDLLALSDEIWTWRALTQPLSGDDIPRIERPPGWVPDWSPDAMVRRRERLTVLERDHHKLAASNGWTVPEQVDYRLLGSVLARARWELDVLERWRCNPMFYVYQTLGAVFDALLQPPPFDNARTHELVRRAEGIPSTLDAARENLTRPVAPFAKLAIDALADIESRLETVARELTPLLDAARAERFGRALHASAQALEGFAEWLLARVERMPHQTAIGRDAYVGFLKRVALLPLSPEQIVAGAMQELDRSIAFEMLEAARNRGLPELSLPASQQEQIARQAAGEQMLRGFCEERNLLSFPDWLHRYRNLPLPAYLAPLGGTGVTDDLTSATRLDQDGISYIPEPAPDLPYFYLATARDPRVMIAHEGVHYYQLARSFAHPDPIRRFYYDSGPNEGIGFYAEEMLLQAGLFDDSPRSREIIYNFMRLRAIRVGVDVRLATGELTLDGAAAELARRVPMDLTTAHDEAALFAAEPGQAITYQTGKLQIIRFLADARQELGAAFNLRQFHDALWINGNVPIALLRWELLGLEDEVALL